MRKRFGTGNEGIIGVRVRVPLDFQSNRDDIMRYEQASYDVQTAAVGARVYQKIIQLRRQFAYQQTRLDRLLDRYHMLQEKITAANQLDQAGLASIKQTPLKSMAMYQREQLRVMEETWLARLDVLENTLRVAAMTQTIKADELYQKDSIKVIEKPLYQTKIVPKMVASQPVSAIKDKQYLAAQRLMEDWRAAWSAQHQDVYFSMYDDQFVPEHGLTQHQWKVRKQRVFATRKHINVRLQDIEMVTLDQQHMRVHFKQMYKADGMTQQDVKSLNLIWHDGQWHIVREQASPLR